MIEIGFVDPDDRYRVLAIVFLRIGDRSAKKHLFAILLLTIGYMIAAVMSHAALRGERQASLGQLESAALEYGLTGKKPADALPSLVEALGLEMGARVLFSDDPEELVRMVIAELDARGTM